MTVGRRNTTLVRRRVRLELTQQQLAELVNEVLRTAGSRWQHAVLGGDYVSRLELGRITWPNSVYRAAFRQVLGVTTDAELGFYCQQVAATRADGDSVRRRDFLATLPAVALTGSSLGEVVAAAMAEPASPPRRVGLEHAHQVSDLARQANALDHLYGGGLAREILAGQVRWAVGLLDSHVDAAARSELPSAIGYLCAFAGWAAHDAGQQDSARHYYVAALRCADQADNWDLRSRVLGDMAQMAAYSGLGDDALTLAQQASLRADRVSPLRRVRISLAEARAYGELGDAQACLTGLGRAEDEYAAADPTAEAWLQRNLNSAELHGEGGNVLYALGRRGQAPAAAETRLREAIATYPETFPRSRALAAVRLASLLMHTGDPAEAVQFGNQVLDATTTVQSARLADGIRQLHHATAHHRGNPAVDDLRQRAARTLAG